MNKNPRPVVETARRNVRRGALRLLSIVPAAISALRHESKVGGQAVIEGVMMRSKTKVSWAVRCPGGDVAVEQFDFPMATQRHKALGWVVVRGAVSLFEQLYLGIKALNRSAELAYPEEKKESSKPPSALKSALSTSATLLVAFALAIGLFMYLPMAALTLAGFEKTAVTFNLLAGILRVGIFLGYLAVISLWKDVRRLFEYHGAEHKAIFAFEDGKELTVDNMRPYLTFHPRCGTSFIILVSVVCIILFSIIDKLVMDYVFTQSYTLPLRLAVHLVLIPLVSGISYEVLKLSDRYRSIRLVRWMIAPGLWLQRITTRQPDDGQLTVAAQALKAAL